MKNESKFLLRLPIELMAKLKQKAKVELRSINSTIRKIIENYLKEHTND
jgi:hypothetical protein